MSQSTVLVGLIAAAFLLYVAAKGRLPVYTDVLWGAKPAPSAKPSNGGSGGSGGSNGSGGFDWHTAMTVMELAATVA